jgi:hypothetical protein
VLQPEFVILLHYSRTPFIWMLVVWITNYLNRLGLFGQVSCCNCTSSFCGLNFSPNFQIYIRNYLLMFYLCVSKHAAVCRNLFTLQAANVACVKKKIQLSGFSAYPDGLPSKLIWISGVLLHLHRELHLNFLIVPTWILTVSV